MKTASERVENLKPARPRLVDPPENAATEQAIEEFKKAVLAKLTLAVGKDAGTASDRDWFVATTLSLRGSSM